MALKKVNQTVWKKTKFKPEEARKQLEKMGTEVLYACLNTEIQQTDRSDSGVSLLKAANTLRILADAYEHDHYLNVEQKKLENRERWFVSLPPAMQAKIRPAVDTTVVAVQAYSAQNANTVN